MDGEPERFLREVILTDERGPDDPCLIWPFARYRTGYAHMQLAVCRVICEEVYGPPPTPEHEAAHSCGRGHLGCVTKSHLAWKTKRENSADQLIHGTRARGERHGMVKLTEPEVREIFALKGRMLQREIAERFGVSASTVSLIHRKKNWGWLWE